MKSALFYEQAAPINSERHKSWSVEAGSDYAFSRTTNSVPLAAVEFPNASREYPIVFTGAGDAEGALLPVAVLGIEDSQNLFIGESGDWTGAYLPAFVRRYPFVFATADEGKTFTVCIDEGYGGCNEEGRGQRLFDDAGEQSDYLKGMVAFLREYQAQYQRTRGFCDRLRELDLLEPMQANVSLNTGKSLSLTGFMVVSRERLKALAGGELEKLIREDHLELIFVHLQSLANFGTMVDRLAANEES